MFLSRVVLNARHKSVQRDLADCYAMHRTVMSLFPEVEGLARESLAALYRLDILRRGERLCLIVQSAGRPEFSKLPEGYVAEEAGNPSSKDLEPLLSSLTRGRQLVFRLRANPTKRVAASGKRVELVGETRQLDWLRRKGEQAGFSLVSASVAGEVMAMTRRDGKAWGWRPTRGGLPAKRLTLAAVVFEGLLVLQDVDLFRRALAAGIGSGKAFGFGLLSVALPRD